MSVFSNDHSDRILLTSAKLKYIFPWPAYRPGAVLLITCIFGTAYIILGNMAGNCIVFGIRIIEAAGGEVTNGAVRGIAIAAATFACGIHAFSRRGGIWLSNIFALIKVLILVLMIVTGICAWAGAFKTKNYATENMAANRAFKDASPESYGYVSAFLAVIFAWSGFDQPTYVSQVFHMMQTEANLR
jgi:amino acid transporter